MGMNVFIARQAIFNKKREVVGYELLYRSSEKNMYAASVSSDKATKQVLSNAIVSFGITNLTDAKKAYINFTENLLLNDFVLLANPSEIIIEILENIKITEPIVEKLSELKKRGYTLALDDYVGGDELDKLLPIIDIIKVDFMQTSIEQQKKIAHGLKKSDVILLAEKVETMEEFERASELGYELFQGYFFRKPVVVSKIQQKFSMTTFNKLVEQVRKKEVNFKICSEIICSDVVLMDFFMRRANILQYYRGNVIKSIQQFLVKMGENELRRLIFLIMIKEDNMFISDEAIKEAYLRGLFMAELIKKSVTKESECEGFIIGMFSHLPKITGESMESILNKITLSTKCVETLLQKKENEYSKFLKIVDMYENGNEIQNLNESDDFISKEAIVDIYMKCIQKADWAFSIFC